MSGQWKPTAEPLVLHVIPSPVARGAQVEARALADELDNPGVRLHRVLTLFDGPKETRSDYSLHGKLRPGSGTGFDPRIVRRLRSALVGLDPAVIVAHGGDPLKYVVPATVPRRPPLIYYAIGTYGGGRGRGVQLAMWRRLIARADVVACEGAEVCDESRQLLGVPADRIVLTPNGRDPAVFRPPCPPRTTMTRPRMPLLVFVGALTQTKRPDWFIEAVARLRAQGVHLRAQLVGEGPLRNALAARASTAGVEILGSRPDIAEILRQADVLVFPSNPAGEGMPGVLIEAGLSGLPVVATSVPGASSVVADGVTGLLVPCEDLTALIEATARLIHDPELRLEMGMAARRHCASQFSFATVAASWLALLEPLVGG